MFVDWLYLQKCPSLPPDDTPSRNSAIKSIMFGDRIQALSFKKAAHNALVDTIKEGLPRYRVISCAFENLPSDSRILDLFVDAYCCLWEPHFDDEKELEDVPQLPIEFLRRVMVKYSEMLRAAKVYREPLYCSYHDHASEDERTECQKKN